MISGDLDDSSSEEVQASPSDLDRERARAEQAEQDRRELQALLLQKQEQARAAVTQPEAPAAMPDPVDDPQAYRQWLEDRDRSIEAKLEQKLSQRDARQAAADARREIKSEFARKYPELSKNWTFVDAAYSEAYPNGNHGMDNVSQVVDKTAKAARRILDELRPGGAVTDQPNRTSVTRGTAATPTPGPRRDSKKQEADAASAMSMSDALRKRQSTSVYFRGR